MSAMDNQLRGTIAVQQAVESLSWLTSKLQSDRKGDAVMNHHQTLIAAHALVQVLERIADGGERIAAALEDIAEGVDCIAANPDEVDGA